MSREDIRKTFVIEANEILDHIETSVIGFEEGGDTDVINNLFRYMHTLKGSSGVAGFIEIYEFTHELENVLGMVRSGVLQFDRGLVDLLLAGLDWIRTAVSGGEDDTALKEKREILIKQISGYGAVGGLQKNSGAGDLKQAVKPHDGEENIGYRYFRVKARFRETIFENGIDPLALIEDLVSLGTIIQRKVSRKLLPDLMIMDPGKCYFAWEFILKTKQPAAGIDNVFLFVKDDNDILIEDVTPLYAKDERGRGYPREKSIGEILVSKGIVTANELTDVLSEQDLTGEKLGAIAVEKGYASEKEIQHALEEQEKIKKEIESTTVRVDSSRLDSLMNILGEIVIEQSAIARISDDIQFNDERDHMLKNALHGLERVTRQFQEELMSIRMIPIGSTFEQFRRFVRDTAHTLGKEISLKIAGWETEIDKTVVERISDPLKHIMRNAISHGIELPEERVAQGKNRTGIIWLKAYHQECNVYIEVTDDGKGCDRLKIKQKAEALGLLKPDDKITDELLLSFLFIPGFSTSENVGDLSGRGVGMDVVKTNIESISGKVEIASREGEGTTIRIKLPLTLAIIEGMLVRIGSSIFIIPLLSIIESLRPGRDQVKTVEGKGEMLKVRGEYITMLRLHEQFGIVPDHDNPWDALAVVVESKDVRIALMIDDLIGQQQIVIKSLDSSVAQSKILSGAAILGDGSVALIMDVLGLVNVISG